MSEPKRSPTKFEKQKQEASRIRAKYPDRIPVIVNKQKGSKLPDIDRKKYLVPADLTFGQFVYIIRKRIKLRPEYAIFLFLNNKTLAPTSHLMSQIYREYKDDCGFLFVTYSSESTYG